MRRRTVHPAARGGAESGFTLVELLVSALVFTFVVAIAMDFFRVQSVAFREGTERADATQNLLYAASTLERDLRTAGTNVAPGQPQLVFAGDDVVAFNADYESNVAGDPSAVYYDPNAPAGAVSALTKAARFTLPDASFAYPDTTYTLAGTISPAELVILFFAPDTSTARSDDYVLYQQINDQAPEEIARNLLHIPAQPFFQYLRVEADTTGVLTAVDTVPSSQLPLAHTVAIHLSPGDTAPYSAIDSIRGVRVRLAATNGRTGAAQAVQRLSRVIWLRNVGLQKEKTCGSAPIFTSIVSATPQLVSGQPQVTLSWAPSVDETGGEKDVIRYVVWRSPAGGPVSQDPLLSMPATGSSYSYVDRTVERGKSYVYSVAAQDCTPSLSAQVSSGTVTIP